MKWWCALSVCWLSLLWVGTILAAPLSKEAVAATLEFAKTHHPELATLLEQLRTSAPKDFDAAVSDLNRIRERLERSRERAPERYELELAEWKLNSQIQLLAARLAMGGDATLEDELRTLLAERLQVRVKLLQDERSRLQKRLEQLEQQIADQQEQSSGLIEREFAKLRNTRVAPSKTNTSALKGNADSPAKSSAAVKPQEKSPVSRDPEAASNKKPTPSPANPAKKPVPPSKEKPREAKEGAAKSPKGQQRSEDTKQKPPSRSQS